MVVLAPDMLTRTTPVLRRSTSLKWSHEHTSQQQSSSSHHMKRMPSPSPTRKLNTKTNHMKHVQSMPTIPSPSTVKTVNIPNQSPSPHTSHHQATPHTSHHQSTPHPRPTLRPSRQSPPMAPSSSMPSLSPVATPTRPPLLRRVVTPTRPSLLRRTAAHMDNTTFERVTRRRLLSPTPVTTTTSTTTTTTIAPPPSPTSPIRRRIPRRFTFAPIHIVTSQLRDANVTEMEHDMIRHEHEHEHEQQQQQQQQQPMTPAKDLVKWWAERESPIWQPPPALHTLIEDDWEERQQQPLQHPITISAQTACTSTTSTATSTTSSRTPLRPPPILLPHTVSSTPAYRYNPITPTCTSHIIELQSPPICTEHDINNIMLSPSFANLSMDVDMMANLPKGWQTQERETPISTSRTMSQMAATWTPRVIDELTQDVGKWNSMDIQ